MAEPVNREAWIDEESRKRAAWQLTARHKDEFHMLREEHAQRMRDDGEVDRKIKREK